MTFVDRDYSITTPVHRQMAWRRHATGTVQALEASPTTSIGPVLTSIAVGLALALLLDARGIVHAGLGMPDGPFRTATLDVGHTALDLSEAAHLTWLWDGLSTALGHAPQPEVPPLLASGATVATPSAQPARATAMPTPARASPTPTSTAGATATAHARPIIAPSATVRPPVPTRTPVRPVGAMRQTATPAPLATHSVPPTLPPRATATHPPRPPVGGVVAVRPPHPGPAITHSAPTPRPAPTARPRRPLRRLLVTGDSLPGYLGPILINDVAAVAPVRGFVDVHNGTGLTRPDFVDWSVVASQQVASDDPDATVVWIGGNDFQNMVLANGQVLVAGTPAWTHEYQRRAEVCMRVWAGGGRRKVYWLAMPPSRNPAWAYDDARIDVALRQAAAHVPGVEYLDILGPITNRGRYADYVYQHGQPVLVRESDGVHVNVAGSTIVAGEVFAVLQHDWHLAGQKS